MANYRVFIDGSAGTTGLRIHERLQERPEIERLAIDEEDRKDLQKRAAMINQADLAFLCLPDAAAKEIVPLIDPSVRLLDTSTAHRVTPGWVYGFPELHGRRALIRESTRVAVPGCHASGFISLVAPLVETGVVPGDYPFTCHSLTGYSGGGKKMIAQYESCARPAEYDSPRAYGLSLHHKHLPEMKTISGLTTPPIFVPIVADYYCGMQVTVPLRMELLPGLTPDKVAETLHAYYEGESQVTVHPLQETAPDGFLAGNAGRGSDRMDIFLTASPDGSQMLLISQFDNLGKGSSGAAVQCMNIMLGLPETAGLE